MEDRALPAVLFLCSYRDEWHLLYSALAASLHDVCETHAILVSGFDGELLDHCAEISPSIVVFFQDTIMEDEICTEENIQEFRRRLIETLVRLRRSFPNAHILDVCSERFQDKYYPGVFEGVETYPLLHVGGEAALRFELTFDDPRNMFVFFVKRIRTILTDQLSNG